MKINNINPLYQNQNLSKKTNFKAKEYAIIKTFLKDGKKGPNQVVQTLKVYEVNEDDTKFLDLVSQKIDLKKLVDTKTTSKQLQRWKTIIYNAIMMTNFNEPQRSFLMTKDNRPCAMLSFKDIPSDTYIDQLVSWPTARGQKVKFAGTSFLKLLFEHAQKNNTKKISLSVSNDSQIDLVEYYRNLGFIQNSSNDIFEPDMIALQPQFSKKANELDSFIKTELIENPKTFHLKDVLDLKNK